MTLFNPDHVTAGVLSKMETKAKKSGTVQVLVIRFEALASTDEPQNLLASIGEAIPSMKGVPALFVEQPTPWDRLSLDVAHVLQVTLNMGTAEAPQELTFRAVLRGLKVARTYKKGLDVYTYTLTLEKDLEPTTDKDLAHLVNAKGMNDRTNRPELVLWAWTFEPVEPEPQSVETDEEQGQH